MTMDLVFVLKWVESVIGCVLYIFHHSVESQLPDWDSSENKCRRPRPMELYGCGQFFATADSIVEIYDRKA